MQPILRREQDLQEAVLKPVVRPRPVSGATTALVGKAVVVH